MAQFSIEERKQISDRINALIGSYDDNAKQIQLYSLSDRIRAREQYRRLRGKLEKIVENGGMKSLQYTLIGGCDKRGITPGGKSVEWIGNNGLEERSRYCGTLKIDGETIFTSGTIARAFEYILNN